MSATTYVRGDDTAPQGTGVKIIAHVCNDLGGRGRGSKGVMVPGR